MIRLETKAAFSIDEAGHLTGTAWPFGSPDRVGDVIQKGAFGSVAGPLTMLAYHKQDCPIGVWDQLTETNAGLEVKGRLLVEEVALARELHALVRVGSVTGLSIGFSVKKAAPRTRGRTITAIDLQEISLVPIPCHPGAQITSVKSSEAAFRHAEIIQRAAAHFRNERTS